MAPAAEGDAGSRLEEVLGTTADDAFSRARELLEVPHPAVGLASGLWARRELLTTAYDRFAVSLPDAVARGGVPTQPELDEWARRHSLGLSLTADVDHPGTAGLIEVRKLSHFPR